MYICAHTHMHMNTNTHTYTHTYTHTHTHTQTATNTLHKCKKSPEMVSTHIQFFICIKHWGFWGYLCSLMTGHPNSPATLHHCQWERGENEELSHSPFSHSPCSPTLPALPLRLRGGNRGAATHERRQTPLPLIRHEADLRHGANLG